MRIGDEIIRFQLKGMPTAKKMKFLFQGPYYTLVNPSIPLTEIVQTILHEIAYILFPEHIEDKTENKTNE
jgi:hypothetical protein